MTFRTRPLGINICLHCLVQINGNYWKEIYVKLPPGAIGHWDTLGTPSYQGVPVCSIPCQWRLVPSSGPVILFVTLTRFRNVSGKLDTLMGQALPTLNPVTPISLDERPRKLAINKNAALLQISVRRKFSSANCKIIVTCYSSVRGVFGVRICYCLSAPWIAIRERLGEKVSPLREGSFAGELIHCYRDTQEVTFLSMFPNRRGWQENQLWQTKMYWNIYWYFAASSLVAPTTPKPIVHATKFINPFIMKAKYRMLLRGKSPESIAFCSCLLSTARSSGIYKVALTCSVTITKGCNNSQDLSIAFRSARIRCVLGEMD